MSAQTFTCDTRLPVPAGVLPDSPEHPCYAMRNAVLVQNQATADTKYDPYPPQRIKEKFVGSADISEHLQPLYVSIAVIVLSLCGLLYFPQTPMRIFLILVTMWSIHYAVGKLPNATV